MKKNIIRRKQIFSSVLSAVLLTNSVQAASAVYADSAYNDGMYTGTGSGFNGDITVSVTVSDGNISAIDVTDQKETPAYWKEAEQIIPDIISANGTEGVDAVSGATFSSEGIKKAVDNALAKSTAPDCFESGVGTESEPYVINNASQLSEFAKSVDNGENYLGKFIILGADIDLTGTENWNPIGAEGTANKNLDRIFAGNFDGQGHIIKGLTIITNEDSPYTEESNVGLFSTISSTDKVSGIKLENVNIKVAGEKAVRAGGITGDITSNAVSGTDGHARVDSCSVSGSVSAKTDAAMAMTGGVVYNNEAYTSKNYKELANKMNNNFNAFPVELTQFGLMNESLKKWSSGDEVTFADEYAEAAYLQPEAEIVRKEELTLNDGTWYGRDSDKKVICARCICCKNIRHMPQGR